MRLHDQIEPTVAAHHRVWVNRQVQDHVRNAELFRDFIWLEDVHYLLVGFDAVSDMQRLDRTERAFLVSESERRWRADGCSVAATYYLVHILSVLDAFSDDIKREIGSKWLPEYARDLGTMNLGDKLETAWRVVAIANVFRPGECPELTEVEQLRQNLTVVFGPKVLWSAWRSLS